jgi:hypothetical protein
VVTNIGLKKSRCTLEVCTAAHFPATALHYPITLQLPSKQHCTMPLFSCCTALYQFPLPSILDCAVSLAALLYIALQIFIATAGCNNWNLILICKGRKYRNSSYMLLLVRRLKYRIVAWNSPAVCYYSCEDLAIFYTEIGYISEYKVARRWRRSWILNSGIYQSASKKIQ